MIKKALFFSVTLGVLFLAGCTSSETEKKENEIPEVPKEQLDSLVNEVDKIINSANDSTNTKKDSLKK